MSLSARSLPASDVEGAPADRRAHDSGRAARHDEALVAAVARRLARELSVFGPMPRTRLAQRCAGHHWHGGCFAAAVEAGVREGRLKKLPFDYLASEQPTHPAPPASAPPVPGHVDGPGLLGPREADGGR